MDPDATLALLGVGAVAGLAWLLIAIQLWRPASRRHLKPLAIAEAVVMPLALVAVLYSILDPLMDEPWDFLPMAGPLLVLMAYDLPRQKFCSKCGHRVPNPGRIHQRPAYCRLCAGPLVRLDEAVKAAA